MKQRSYTKCENFVNDCLTYINRQAGCIEYVDKNGNNCEEGFADNPMDAIQKAAEKVVKQRIVKY